MRAPSLKPGIYLSILLILFAFAGCSQPGNSPVLPSGEDLSAGNGNNINRGQELIASDTISPSGGSIDTGWFKLEFSPDSLTENAIVELWRAESKVPHEGAAVGGWPVHVLIRSVNGNANSPINPAEGYRCIFNIDKLPASEGNFTANNQYIDIYGEYKYPDGIYGKGAAWAGREGDTVTRVMPYTDVTLTLVDFSSIPEMTAEPVFTDDPTKLTGPYARYGQVAFNENNLGPLNGRIPVILIHGLQLDNMNGEPYDLNDQEAVHGESGWIIMINALNSNNQLFNDFKFFWYCYPTGDTVFGSNGSASVLQQKLVDWFGVPMLKDCVYKPLIIVSHSMGGLVGREFLNDFNSRFYPVKIITVATPNYGSPIVNVGADLVNIPLFGWLDTFLTPGVMDLACDETIHYTFMYINFTADLDINLNLRALNLAFPENDPRLILYGATTTSTPGPGVSDDHYLPLQVLKMVTSPSWLKEGYNSYHSDCVVNWPSQYYTRTGGPDLTRRSTRYHMEIMSDPVIHQELVNELYDIKDGFEN